MIKSSFAQSGTCGSTTTDCSWEFNSTTATLSIVGNGLMDNYVEDNFPWFSFSSEISTVIIEGVTRIGNYAFASCTSLQSVSISNTVTHLGEGAFYCCPKLKSFTMPDSVTSTGFMVFLCCSSLEFVSLSKNLQNLNDGTFYGCTALKSIALDSVVSLNYRAFYKCTSLQSVTFSNSFVLIGIESFGECTSLKTFFIPDSVTVIGANAFQGSTSLNTIVYGGLNPPTCQSDFSSLQFDIIVQNDYKSTSLCSKTVIRGFEGTCGGNCYWKVDSSMAHMKINGSGVMDDFEDKKPWSVFTNVLKNVTVEGVTSIGNNAFYEFTSLKSISGSINAFGSYSLTCTSIESIVIGSDESVYIGSNAFSNCKNLKLVTIKPRLKHISNDTSKKSCAIQSNAFANCSNIESFIIDGYVDEIKEYAFSFNEINNVKFQYNSISSPQNCSNLDPNNETMLLPIFSENASLINVSKNYQSNIFCPCDKLGCPLDYIENNEYDKIQNASVLIEKTLDERTDESSSNESCSSELSQSNGSETKTSSSIENEESSESHSKERERSESHSNTSNGNEQNEKSSNETSESSGTDEEESEAVMNAFFATLLFVITII